LAKWFKFIRNALKSWQAIPSQFMTKLKENHEKRIGISTGSSCSWKRNSIQSLKKTEGNLFCKIIEILYECFEIWQAIPSQFIRKPNENHRKLIEISTGSSFSWNPAGSEIQSKVLRKLKEIALANWLKFCKNVLKVGRRFPHKS